MRAAGPSRRELPVTQRGRLISGRCALLTIGFAPSASTDTMRCIGLGAGTLKAYIKNGKLQPHVVMEPSRLSAAEKQTLRDLPVGHLPANRQPGTPANTPAYVRSLDSMHGEYDLTAVNDPDSDAVCITGLPLASVDDTLHDLAVTELLVFGAVLLLAGVLGTVWVGLSLRPLRRVA